jgi:multiple sugar transport system substrate-binding protein
MKTPVKTLYAALAVVGLGMSPAWSETVLKVLHAWPSHNERIHVPVAEAFMAQNPDIKIEFLAPAANYEEGHIAVVRGALTAETPDIWYSGHNLTGDLIATLAPREQIVNLDPFIAAEGADWLSANYDDNVLALGKVDGNQWGIPFNASTPIVYYNLDLVKQAGGDPDNLPTDWDGIVDLATRINALGDDMDGITINLIEGDWLWQAMLFSYGGTLMNTDRTEVTFGDAAGMQAVTLLRRLTDEAGMPLLNEEQGIQQFVAGQMGMFVGSTAEVRTLGDAVGGKFALRTGSFPMGDAEGRLPTGGNSAVMLTADPEKQKAAWEFIKFATGPEGQKLAVLGSGYMPTNKRTVEAEFLGSFYAENPDWTTSMKQWPVAKAWFGYPDAKSVDVWRAQHEVLYAIGRGDVTPEDGLAQLAQVTSDALAK